MAEQKADGVRKARSMTQLERAIRAWFEVSTTQVEDMAGSTAIAELETVLGEAQNGPPDGAADGTLSTAQWTALRDVQRAASMLAAAHLAATRVFK